MMCVSLYHPWPFCPVNEYGAMEICVRNEGEERRQHFLSQSGRLVVEIHPKETSGVCCIKRSVYKRIFLYNTPLSLRIEGILLQWWELKMASLKLLKMVM